MSAETGQVLRNTIKISNPNMMFQVNRSSGMVFVASNELYVTHMLGEDMPQAEWFDGKGSKPMLAKFDPESTSAPLTSIHKLATNYGHTSVIRYYPTVNANSLFLGGSTDKSASSDNWRPAFY